MAALLPILGQVLGAIIPAILQWFFSGTVTNTFSEVPGLQKLDNAKPDEPLTTLDLPTLDLPGENK